MRPLRTLAAPAIALISLLVPASALTVLTGSGEIFPDAVVGPAVIPGDPNQQGRIFAPSPLQKTG